MPQLTGIIDTLFHPPLGVLNEHLDPGGPYYGNVTLTNFSGVAVNDTYGVIPVVASVLGLQLGYTLGWESGSDIFGGTQYELRLYQLVVQHQLLGGLWVTTQTVDSHSLAELVLWKEAAPGRIGIYTTPGITLDFYYLRVT